MCNRFTMLWRVGFLFLFVIFPNDTYQKLQRQSINLKFLELLPNHMTDQFLGSLFNSSLANVMKIADRFKFCTADKEALKFLVFRNDKMDPSELYLSSNDLDMRIPTKILIHGWYGTGDNEFIKRLANQYHKKGRYNVIGVDWSNHSKRDYVSSSCSTRDIGKVITEFILTLIGGDLRLLPNIHLIGHSLGAQVAAFAGKSMKSRTKRNIGRITGLDAAAPLFEFPFKVPKHLRLNAEDAEYVDGIHTNMGFFGFASAFGTSDFFVENGSPIQPGCNTNNFFEDLVCSHGRSVDLFLESITSKKLIGQECPNPFVFRIGLCSNRKRAVMGEEISKDVTGNYFLDTYDKPPYGKG
ncbi:hypothetical protein WA026_005885 [Henosepilachna vigintioctopunctata]|uniref:Lipase domain-containing protein n=1 Tax=Henosepilachna vigintioctopunctata TaxID=420089 RepID=A0AAW1U4J6_9CUCU